jgi:preprotein translocase subunit SecF
VFEVIRPGTNFDFIGKWKLCILGSLGIIVIGLALIPFGRLRWGIDFAGGTEVQVHFDNASTREGQIRSVVEGAGVGETSVVRYGEKGQEEFLIRFRGNEEKQSQEQNQVIDRIQKALEQKLGAVRVDRVEYVGPKVGAELRRAGTKALAIAFVLILIYVGFRFTPQFAPGAVIALVHDVLVTSSIWIMLGQQFDLQVLAALLAIIGYSINDTIIIYDRIREVMGVHTSQDLPSVINLAVNQTLSRTVLTSGATFLSVMALLVLGGDVIFPFAGTMAIGIIVGTYSSIYIASPIMLLLTERKRSGEKAAAAAAAPHRTRGAGKGKPAKAAKQAKARG